MILGVPVDRTLMQSRQVRRACQGTERTQGLVNENPMLGAPENKESKQLQASKNTPAVTPQHEARGVTA